MRRIWIVLLCLAFVATAALPASATTVTVQFAGTWDSVVDNANVTNGSLAVGGSFVATLTFDDATPDSNGTANVGDYLLSAASTDLVLATGDYSFTLLSSSPVSFGIEDNVGGQDGFGFFAEYFSTSGPLASGASTGYGYANPGLFDNSQTAHSSDNLTALPWDANLYDNTSFYFLIEVLGKGAGKFIELSGPISQLSVLPEPSVVILLLAGFAVAVTRRG